MRRFRDESGQTLILIAAALVVLLGFLALAVDLGMLYAERRAMQNAADAGALAGARAMCEEENENTVKAEARKFAEANGATDVDVRVEGNEIVVRASERVDFYFARVLGEQFRQGDASAVAASACGSASTVGGGGDPEGGGDGSVGWLWPIAMNQSAWNVAKNQPGQEFVLIGSKQVVGTLEGGFMSGGHRGWLNFGKAAKGLPFDCTDRNGNKVDPCKGNCGEDDLECWIKCPFPLPITVPIYISGQTGVMNSAFELAGSYGGEARVIPVYDGSVDKKYCENNPTGDPCLYTDCNDDAYHVVDFACVYIKRYCKKLDGCEFRGQQYSTDGKEKNEKVLVVEVPLDQTVCFSQANTTTGSPVTTGDPSAASLIPIPDWWPPN